jgi:cob(I)alamin adenosyltransferase
MTIYTRHGDEGNTRGLDGRDLPKDDPRIEAVGAVDELNSHVGLCLAASEAPEPVREALTDVQRELFSLGAMLTSVGTDHPLGLDIAESAIGRMENAIDEAWKRAGKLEHFILPGGCETSARLQVARTVCRRAERRCVQFSRTCPLDAPALRYLNRLSDLLFALARLANALGGQAEATWSRGDEDRGA